MRTMLRLLGIAAICVCLASATMPSARRATAAAPAQAATCGISGTCKVFLPLILGPPLVPVLNEPADGAQIISRAPLLSWTPTISSTYQIQVSTDPTFATTAVNSVDPWSTPLPAQAVHITGSNLAIATIYYWRVGVLYQGTYHYTSVRTFRTPETSPKLPASPALVAPANGATLPAREVTLNWQPVAGALYYRVRVFSPDSSIFDSQVVPATTLSHQVGGLLPGTTYTWRVRTLDQYGWGSFSAPSSFTAP